MPTPITIKRSNGSVWETLHPLTVIAQVSGLQTALDAKINTAQIGVANGVAQLDANVKLPMSIIPDVIINGLDRIGSITLTGNADIDDLINANPAMAHGTARKGDFWTVAHATANASINISDVGGDDIFMDPTKGSFTADTVSVQPGDWLIYDGYDSGTSKYRWIVQNNNSANLYSPIGHSHQKGDINSLIVNRALQSSAGGLLEESAVTSIELGYLAGAQSSIQTQINGKAPNSHASAATTHGVGSPTLHGHVKTINVLTTASHVDGEALSAHQGKVLKDAVDLKAPLASPSLTGVPTAPTPADGTNNTQIATTSFVLAQNVASANKLKYARTILLSGHLSGSGDFDGSQNISINATVADDSHNHGGTTVKFTGTSGNHVVNNSTLNTALIALDGAIVAVASAKQNAIKYEDSDPAVGPAGDICFVF